MTDIIIDNGDAAYSTVGAWTYYAGQGYDNDVAYVAAGTGTNTATWDLGSLFGNYELQVHYSTHSNRATDAPYTIKNHRGVVSTPSVAGAITSVADNVNEAGSADDNATTVDVNQEKLASGATGGVDTTPLWF